jgi:hypothetical protein
VLVRLIIAVALFGSVAACRKAADAPSAPSAEPARVATPQPSAGASPDREATRRPTPVGAVDPPRLPEDPVAAKNAGAQWQEHLLKEEEERQMLFDRPRLQQHRAIVKLIKAIRARYDRAKSEPAVAKARAAARSQLDAVHARVNELDPWGVNSRLLPDYEALRATFAGDYAEAKIAALAGDATKLETLRATVEQHLESIDEWLEEAAEGKDEE